MASAQYGHQARMLVGRELHTEEFAERLRHLRIGELLVLR